MKDYDDNELKETRNFKVITPEELDEVREGETYLLVESKEDDEVFNK